MDPTFEPVQLFSCSSAVKRILTSTVSVHNITFPNPHVNNLSLPEAFSAISSPTSLSHHSQLSGTTAPAQTGNKKELGAETHTCSWKVLQTAQVAEKLHRDSWVFSSRNFWFPHLELPCKCSVTGHTQHFMMLIICIGLPGHFARLAEKKHAASVQL